MPYIKTKNVLLFMNFGDHSTVYDKMIEEVKDFKSISLSYKDDLEEFKTFVNELDTTKNSGTVSVLHEDIFKAV